MKNLIEKYCLECGKQISGRNFYKRKFCSQSCSGIYNGKRRMENPETLEKFVNAGSGARDKGKNHARDKGKNHPAWKGGLVLKKCEKCDKNFEVTRYKDKKGYGRYCSMECYRAVHIKPRLKTKCLQCGTEVELREKRLKRFKFCSGTCRAVYNRSHSYRRINLIESKMEVILKELNVFYQFEKDVENIVTVDFFIRDKICIFCDGSYWHDKDKERDEFVNSFLVKLGYIIVRFSDEEINEKQGEVKIKLNNIIYNQ